MKNKKLFAILTLVCFMMTLVPFAAFAADSTTAISTVKLSSNTTIDVSFDGAVTTGSALKTNFKVYVNNAEQTVTTLDQNGATAIRLTVGAPMTAADGNSLKVVYSATEDSFLLDGTGKKIISQNKSVTIVAPKVDTKDNPPVVSVAGQTVVITFDQAVSGSVAANWNLTVNGGASVNPAAPVVAGNTVTLTFAGGTFKAGDSLVLNYTGAGLVNGAGVVVAPFSKVLTAPVSATAGADADTSRVYVVKDNPTITIDSTTGMVSTDITYSLKNNIKGDEYEPMYFWFTEADNSNKATTAVVTVTGAGKVAAGGPVVIGGDTVVKASNQVNTEDKTGVTSILGNVWYTNSASATGTLTVTFNRGGVYTLHAATLADMQAAAIGGKTEANILSSVTKIKTVSTNVKVTVNSTDESATKYKLQDVTVPALLGSEAVEHAGTFAATLNVSANNVANTTLKFRLEDSKGDEVIGKTVKIEANSANVVLGKNTATTNALGEFSVDVSGKLEGNYKIYITSGAYTCTVNVTVGATTPAYIKAVKELTAPIDRDNQDFSKKIRFAITDINGNMVNINSIIAQSASSTAAKSSDLGQLAFVTNPDSAAAPYVSIVSQPSASTLENENVYLIEDTKANGGNDGRYATLYFTSPVTAEGDYEIKVALDNGNYANVKFTVKEFTTPVKIDLVYAAPSVELGGNLYIDTLNYIDANGVTKDCTNYVTLAATGYAIDKFDGDGTVTGLMSKGALKAKSDEKYVGSKITVTAVDERYNLTATTDVNVADAAAGLSFSSKTGEVNINNQITVSLVDSNGNRVAVGNGGINQTADISYVVLEKPQDALVSASTSSMDNNLLSAGTFKMNLTSNKIGNVKVQVIAKITNRAADTTTQNVTKYYSGTQTFAIGTGETGNTVVMSIGSNHVVVNNEVKTIDAAPIVQNNRTFVPFRALAEAFGATVAYDEATQAVTAELNGVKVVLTVGSPSYTVNGEAKTADVAPFISGSRTMVPVRFAAEAFGIKVTPTYDENGATADILFNM